MAFPTEMFPPMPPGSPPRRIYVRGLTAAENIAMRTKGYEPTDLMTMARGTEKDEILYLYAKLQAYDEQTVPFTEDDRKVLELALRAHGCLNPKATRLNIDAKIDAADIERLLGWGDSRHTLKGNSTVQNAQYVIDAEDKGE